MEKKRPQSETRKLRMGKLKVGKTPHTNMISKPAIVRRGQYKCRILEMPLKLREQQLEIILYICRLLYQNFMGTAHQKSTTDTNTKKKKQSKHNTRNSHQIPREENKRGSKENRLKK